MYKLKLLLSCVITAAFYVVKLFAIVIALLLIAVNLLTIKAADESIKENCPEYWFCPSKDPGILIGKDKIFTYPPMDLRSVISSYTSILILSLLIYVTFSMNIRPWYFVVPVALAAKEWITFDYSYPYIKMMILYTQFLSVTMGIGVLGIVSSALWPYGYHRFIEQNTSDTDEQQDVIP